MRQTNQQAKKKYNEANREKVNESQRNYDLRHRKEKKQYKLDHKEENDIYNSQYYQKNKDKIKDNQQKKKDATSAEKRLLAFRNEIKDGPIFVCLSCNRSMFKSGVKLMDKDAVTKLFEKCPDNIIQKATNKRLKKPTKLAKFAEKKILCRNCHKSLYNDKKIPRMSAYNGLELDEIPEELKLTDYEEQLIALNLLFIKIFKLPKSGMNAVVDRVINVPLEVDDVAKTVTTLPRNFKDAKLIPVNWKRKLSMAGSHIQAYVRADVLAKAVEKLKELKNPHYINIDINQNFNIPEEPFDEMTKDEMMEIEDEFLNDLAMSMETDEKEDTEEMQVENLEELPLAKDDEVFEEGQDDEVSIKSGLEHG